jgi:DNA-binding response OmpR family regulator
VTDNGAGVPLSERENIFKPFYRLSENMQSGTGMGLYIVQSIVRACNGQIQINNGQQKGFSISVLLPLYAHNPNASSDGLSEEPVLQPQEFDMESDDFFLSDQKPTILVVEDNPDMQSFLQKTLTTCNVLLANDGVEGLKMMEKNEISLVISDIMMPNMDGIAFCKQIRANFLWSHLPVIILTAKTQVASKIEALNIGADAYVEKPFSVTYLQAQIENLLENRRKLLEKFVETPYVSLNSIAGNQADEDFLLKMTDIMEKNISRTDYSVEQLARDMNISSSGLFVKIKSLSGVSPKKLMMTIRLKHASERLLENKYRVGEICYMVGFNNPSYFAKCFQKQFGILPKDYAEKKMT